MSRLTAKDLMTPDVLVARADWSLDRLADFFINNYISGAPVVAENDELIGVVSSTDIVRHDSLHINDSDPAAIHEYYFHGLENRYAREEIATLHIQTEPRVTVRDIMTPVVFDVQEETPLPVVADTLIRGHIHRLFVTRQKKIVGVLTALDLLKVIRDSAES